MSLNPIQLVRTADTIIETFALVTAQNYDLPSLVKAGQQVLVYNETTNNSILTIRSSDTSSIDTLRDGYCLLFARQDNPTSSSHWKVLDFYEEGTWTPALSAVSGSAPVGVTYTTQAGRFWRKNNLVWVNMELTWSAVTTPGTGTGTITGIPYNIHSGMTALGSVSTQLIDFSATSRTWLLLYAANSDNVLRLQLAGDNQTNVFVDTADFSGGTFNKRINGNVQYKKA